MGAGVYGLNTILGRVLLSASRMYGHIHIKRSCTFGELETASLCLFVFYFTLLYRCGGWFSRVSSALAAAVAKCSFRGPRGWPYQDRGGGGGRLGVRGGGEGRSFLELLSCFVLVCGSILCVCVGVECCWFCLLLTPACVGCRSVLPWVGQHVNLTANQRSKPSFGSPKAPLVQNAFFQRPRPVGMPKHLVLARFEPVVIRFGPLKDLKQLKNRPFWDRVQGSKAHPLPLQGSPSRLSFCVKKWDIDGM